MIDNNPFDTLLLPPEYMRSLRESTASEVIARQNAVLPTLLGSIKVIESAMARMPAKRHKKRRWMSESYHRRIQKKWLKRFGTVPTAFLLASDYFKLDLARPFPPIRKNELAAFGGYGAISVLAASS